MGHGYAQRFGIVWVDYRCSSASSKDRRLVSQVIAENGF
jgi:hypothetical protein